MEGLIPMVYKSLKKNKTRRNYECLSSGAAQAYNISNFYVTDDVDDDRFRRRDNYVTPAPDYKVSDLSGPHHHHHRRYNSMHVTGAASSGFASTREESSAKSKQLVRFRSHRMFSCVTGA